MTPEGEKKHVFWKTGRAFSMAIPAGMTFVGGINENGLQCHFDEATLGVTNGIVAPEHWLKLRGDVMRLQSSSLEAHLEEDSRFPNSIFFVSFTEDQAAEAAYKRGLNALSERSDPWIPLKNGWSKLGLLQVKRKKV